jgi:hypothetical protein
VFIRPVNSVTVNSNYFLPGVMGADHALKMGGTWHDANSTSINHTGGYATVRFPSDAALLAGNTTCATVGGGCQVDLTRDGYSAYDLTNYSAYLQDTVTHGRATLQLGIRYDYNHDTALAASIVANPLSTQWLPSINFNGADPGAKFNNFSPRLGLTYDLQGTGKTLARANYAMYYGQVGTGAIASTINPVGTTTLRYPWVDLNGDKSAQANEVQASASPLSASTNWSAANPANTVSANSVDQNLKNDRTDEFILGLDREVGAGFAVGVSYIWRKYSDFQFNDRPGLTTADYAAVSFTPTGCPAQDGNRISAGSCSPVTYYQPTFQLPTIINLTNAGGFNRSYNGVEITGRKRLSNHWLMNTSFGYNSTLVNFDDFTGSILATSSTSSTLIEDPTNRVNRDAQQYDYPTTGSGIGNVWVNAKWLFKVSGMYQAPWSINLSAFYNARQGYPYERFVQGPSRANGAGIPLVVLDPIGESRLPNYQNIDFHVERPVRFGSARFVPALDIFNVGNGNTIQAIRGTQNASNANQVQALLAPRVMRVGVKVSW